MKFLKRFLGFFSVITTAVLIVVTVTVISGYESLSPYITLQVLISGAVTAIVTAAVYSVDFRSRKHFIIMTLIHYILLCIVMGTLGVLFGWIDKNPAGIIMMCIYVAVVYAIVFGMTYILAKREADELNRALDERNKKN